MCRQVGELLYVMLTSCYCGLGQKMVSEPVPHFPITLPALVLTGGQLGPKAHLLTTCLPESATLHPKAPQELDTDAC